MIGSVVLGVLAGCAVDSGSATLEPDVPDRVTVPPETTTTAPTTTTLPPPPPGPFAHRLPLFSSAPLPAHKMPLAPGPAAHLSRIETTDPVAFVTIDDGYTREPHTLGVIRDSKVPVSLFLISSTAARNPGYFSDLRDQTGATIHAHSVSHRPLAGLPYETQRREICGSADQLQQLYGTRPTLFRAPFGSKDATTLQVAAECGMKAVLYWRETVTNGRVDYQHGNRVQPGDIILMHFGPGFVEDYLAVLQAIKDAGLVPARIEDYL